jgi:hypothetical protein
MSLSRNGEYGEFVHCEFDSGIQEMILRYLCLTCCWIAKCTSEKCREVGVQLLAFLTSESVVRERLAFKPGSITIGVGGGGSCTYRTGGWVPPKTVWMLGRKSLPFPGIRHRLLGRPACGLLLSMTELFQLPYRKWTQWKRVWMKKIFRERG